MAAPHMAAPHMAAPLPPGHTICKIIEGIAKDMIDAEFSSLVRETERFETATCKYWKNLALTPEERAKFNAQNRYSDVLPNPNAHVRATLLLSPDSAPGPLAGYINADIVRLPGCPFSYLQTQAPTEHSTGHFWEMVAYYKSPAIAMLTPLVEKGTVEATQYWPCVGETIEYGPIHVMCADEYNCAVHQSTDCALAVWPNIIVRAFTVWDSRAGSAAENPPQSVIQLHYTAWPGRSAVAGSNTGADAAVAATVSAASSSASALGLTEFEAFVQRWREVTAGMTTPAIVHCSAGLGRSGTFVAIDYLLRIILQRAGGARATDDLSESIELLNAVEISVAEVVTMIRSHRAVSVQNKTQYAFIYEFIRHWIRQGHFD